MSIRSLIDLIRDDWVPPQVDILGHYPKDCKKHVVNMAPTNIDTSPYKVLAKKPDHSPKIIFKRNDPAGLPRRKAIPRPRSADEPTTKKYEDRKTDEYFIPLPLAERKTFAVGESLLPKSKLVVDRATQDLAQGSQLTQRPQSPYASPVSSRTRKALSRPHTAGCDTRKPRMSPNQSIQDGMGLDFDHQLSRFSRASTPFADDNVGDRPGSPHGNNSEKSPRAASDGSPAYAMWTKSKRMYTDDNPFGLVSTDLFQYEEDKPYLSILKSRHLESQKLKEEEMHRQVELVVPSRRSAKQQSAKAAAALRSLSLASKDVLIEVVEEEYIKPHFTTAHFQEALPARIMPKKITASKRLFINKQEAKRESAAAYEKRLLSTIVSNHATLVGSESNLPQMESVQVAIASNTTDARLLARSLASDGSPLGDSAANLAALFQAGSVDGLGNRRGSLTDIPPQLPVYSSARNLPYEVRVSPKKLVRLHEQKAPERREKGWNTSTKLGDQND